MQRFALPSLLACVACLGCTASMSGQPDAAVEAPEAGGADAGVEVRQVDEPDAAANDAGADISAIDVLPDSAADVSVEPEGVPVFILQGQVGRTALSCDGGRSWINDQSEEDSVRCRPTGSLDCSHDSRAGRGLAFSGGYFFSTGGFGVRRSDNGRDWDTVAEDGGFGAIAAGENTIVAGAFRPSVSTDFGASFRTIEPTGLMQRSVRLAAYFPGGDGRFAMVSSIISMDQYDLVVSNDGINWVHPDVPPDLGAGCLSDLNATGGLVEGNGVALALGSTGRGCLSSDQGQTWVSRTIASGVDSRLLWTGAEFAFYSAGSRYRSADGTDWVTTPLVPSGLRLGAVAYGGGRFVGVNRGGAYGSQQVYTSADGVNWEAATGLDASHPIVAFQFGRVAVDASICD